MTSSGSGDAPGTLLWQASRAVESVATLSVCDICGNSFQNAGAMKARGGRRLPTCRPIPCLPARTPEAPCCSPAATRRGPIIPSSPPPPPFSNAPRRHPPPTCRRLPPPALTTPQSHRRFCKPVEAGGGGPPQPVKKRRVRSAEVLPPTTNPPLGSSFGEPADAPRILLQEPLLDWEQEQMLGERAVDAKLWPGAYASGWRAHPTATGPNPHWIRDSGGYGTRRVVPKYRGAEKRCHWSYVSPEGARVAEMSREAAWRSREAVERLPEMQQIRQMRTWEEGEPLQRRPDGSLLLPLFQVRASPPRAPRCKRSPTGG